jgi:diguanylate cyclase (GGDEF)-like protein
LENREHRKQNITVRQYRIIFALVLVVAVSVIASVFYQVYSVTRQNLENSWKVSTEQLARDVEYALICQQDAIRFSSSHVERMIRNGASNSDILEYMEDESEVYAGVVDGNISGLYGYVCGEYLDGSGWIPPEDYEPVNRPWYVGAVEAKGEIALVHPYLNLQTNTMMMSVAKCLEDGKSVISMDVYLESIQKLSREQMKFSQLDSVLVLDKDGYVVASADEKEIGKNYRTGNDADEKELMEGLLGKEDTTFCIEGWKGHSGDRMMVFAKQLSQGWYVLQIVDEQELIGVQANQYVIFAFVLAMVIILLVCGLRVVTREHREAEQFGQLAQTDGLTGIRNRISGESEVSQTIRELTKKANPRPLNTGRGPMADLAALANRAASTSVKIPTGGMFLVLDTDRFKTINDTCGHEVGDQVLIHIADSMRNSLRAGDIVFRLGGDEFAAFAQGISNPQEAEEILDELRKRVSSLQLPELGSITPTISIGVTFFRTERREDFDSLYHRADDAMYQSKRAGGNRVTYN